MISVSAALNHVMATTVDLGAEYVSLHDCIGRVLGEAISADRPFPPFDRVTMDGIAIDSRTWTASGQYYKVESIAAAGEPQKSLSDAQCCVEVMTGAPLPTQTDTVIRYEDLVEVDLGYKVMIDLQPGKNVHRRGSDYPAGSELLPVGQVLKAIDVNVLATVGKSHVNVRRCPRVAVISSGDELIDISDQPAAHQIRRSNSPMLVARLREMGIKAKSYHLPDDKQVMLTKMKEIISDTDAILISGGVSKGKFDYMPEVLRSLGYQQLFHRVAQRPGKPFWFGRSGDQVVFAFPGNPVSTLACFHRYFVPWWAASTGRPSQLMTVELTGDVVFHPDLTYFAQASIHQNEQGGMMATVRHGNGSGDMVSPTYCDGFVQLPAGKSVYKTGESYAFLPFRRIFW